MKIIAPLPVADRLLSRLPADVQVVWADAEGTLDGDAGDAIVYFNGFYLKPTAYRRVLAAAPAIQWQHSPSAGVDHLLTPEFLARDITLTNSAGLYAIPIAEYVLAMILDWAKRMPDLRSFQAQHHWHQMELGELTDTTLLILGAGSIGQEMAKRAYAFGMRVWGSRRSAQPLPLFERIVGAEEWRSLLPEANFVVVSTPLTPATQGMIDTAAFQAMRPDAYFINVARGAIVNEGALLTALQEHWIAGAAIDTFSSEPLPEDSPFWALPNLTITPHCAGLSPRNIQRIVDLFLENLTRYRQGRPLLNVVDKQVGY